MVVMIAFKADEAPVYMKLKLKHLKTKKKIIQTLSRGRVMTFQAEEAAAAESQKSCTWRLYIVNMRGH
jgi:hypothetical protein